MLKATKVRLYPTPEQAEFLTAQFGAVRFVYNKALHVKKHAYDFHGVSLAPKRALKPILAVAKRSRKYRWLKNYDSIALQQAIMNLDGAFKRFFDKSLANRFPQFKRRHGKQSSYHCVGIKVFENAIKLPKLKQPIKARIHRTVEGELKSITLSKTPTGKYFASILMDTPDLPKLAITAFSESDIIGCDMGLSHWRIDSNGHKTDNSRCLVKAYRNLRRKQKALSRTQKGSKGRAKARLLVAQCHEKVSNARNDFQHKPF